MARKICCIQLVPYHSAVFGLPGRTCEQLQSALLSKKFVKEDLARRKDALIVATRRYQEWDLPKQENIINYVR